MMHNQTRGFLLMETIVGLSLIGVLILGLLAVTSQYANAARVMKSKRAAYLCAEGVLSKLQAGGTQPTERPDMQIQVHAAATPGTRPPDGFVWATVNVEHGRTSARLVGLVPQHALANSLGRPTETDR